MKCDFEGPEFSRVCESPVGDVCFRSGRKVFLPGNAGFGSGERCWSESAAKRLFDFVAALAGLIALAPVMAVVALVVKMSSAGPILFRQVRSGVAGSTFTIYKFRTMRSDMGRPGPLVTRSGDNRLTPVGATMRRWKLDELPQLWNVLIGDMSLVGPRPKVPEHQIEPLPWRPGITGAASLAFRDEESIIEHVSDRGLHEYQVRVLMPLKLKLDRDYMHRATLVSDLQTLASTLAGTGQRVRREDLAQFEISLVNLSAAVQSWPACEGSATREAYAGELAS